jgi:hypothetical protein
VQNAGLHTESLKLGSLADLARASGNVREALLATRELLPLVEARGVDLRRPSSRKGRRAGQAVDPEKAVEPARAHSRRERTSSPTP